MSDQIGIIRNVIQLLASLASLVAALLNLRRKKEKNFENVVGPFKASVFFRGVYHV